MYVKYKKPNIAVVHTAAGATFTFIPGVNEIDSKLWSQLLENKNFKADVDAKHYVVEIDDDEDDIDVDVPNPEAGPDAPKPFAPLSKASDDKTARLISETYDIKTLKDMKRNETRRNVIELIDAQINKLQEDRRANRGRVNTDEENV